MNGMIICILALIKDGAAAMKAKLLTYAASQLPGGKYWEPEPQVETVLCQLRPNNDLCESILGLNHYLVTALPNMTQQTRSNLIEVKKNKTLGWLESLSPKRTGAHYQISSKKPTYCSKTLCRKTKKYIAKQRRHHMIQVKQKRDRREQKQAEECQKLSKVHQ